MQRLNKLETNNPDEFVNSRFYIISSTSREHYWSYRIPSDKVNYIELLITSRQKKKHGEVFDLEFVKLSDALEYENLNRKSRYALTEFNELTRKNWTGHANAVSTHMM